MKVNGSCTVSRVQPIAELRSSDNSDINTLTRKIDEAIGITDNESIKASLLEVKNLLSRQTELARSQTQTIDLQKQILDERKAEIERKNEQIQEHKDENDELNALYDNLAQDKLKLERQVNELRNLVSVQRGSTSNPDSRKSQVTTLQDKIQQVFFNTLQFGKENILLIGALTTGSFALTSGILAYTGKPEAALISAILTGLSAIVTAVTTIADRRFNKG